MLSDPTERMEIGVSDQELAAGTRVSEYRIELMIGRGGFGTVYRAVHPVIGKRVAIKVLARRYAADPHVVSRFVSEARVVNQIRHPNIIDIFSFNQLDDGRHYYVMEYIEGESLEHYIANHGAMPLVEALPILSELALALDAAHAKGIAHRDVKPENILLAYDGSGTKIPKLLDFGLAKLMSPSEVVQHRTNTGVPMGTPHYMSPEQCRGRDVDHRTDIYSFGIVTYRLLTGVLPFDDPDYFELLHKKLMQEPPRPSSLNPSLAPAVDHAIAWMMRKDPADRPHGVIDGVFALDPDGAFARTAVSRSPRPSKSQIAGPDSSPPSTAINQSRGTSEDDAETVAMKRRRQEVDAPRDHERQRTSQPKLAVEPDFGPRYRLLGTIGEGGVVYRAHDTVLRGEVALKILHDDSEASLARFHREIALARKITSPNVLRVFDLAEHDGLRFLSMELVDGEDLAALMRREKQLPLPRVLAMFRQVCVGLAAAHEQGIVHRDLKPQNVLVDKQGKVRVADFGLARSLGESALTTSGAVLGSPAYMSPEQVKGEPTDERSDIYSLGVMLYQLVTGEVPFRGDTAREVMEMRLHNTPTALREARPDAPAYLEAIVARCLAVAPAERYASVRELLAKLDAGGGGRPLASSARRPVWFVAALVVVAGALGIVVWPRGDDHVATPAMATPVAKPTPKLTTLPPAEGESVGELSPSLEADHVVPPAVDAAVAPAGRAPDKQRSSPPESASRRTPAPSFGKLLVTVSGAPTFEILVDKRRAVVAHGELLLPAGGHRIEVSAPGMMGEAFHVEIGAGTVVRRPIALKRAATDGSNDDRMLFHAGDVKPGHP